MATYRIGIGSFSLAENGGVGIGTDSAGLGNLMVEGTVKTTDLDVLGVSTFTRYAGFAADDLNINRDTSLTGEHSTQGDIVVGLNSTSTVSTGATVTVGTVESVSIGTHFSPPTGGVEDRPEAPVEGTVRFNIDLNTLEFYNGVEWRQFTVSGASGRGITGGGTSGGYSTKIEQWQIMSQGNAIDFGDLTVAGRYLAPASNSIRGIFYGRKGPADNNTIDYITIASSGTAQDFGDATNSYTLSSGMSSSTRGVFAGGYSPSLPDLDMEYVEIMTTGNGIDFGDMYTGAYACGYLNSPTRGIISGGTPGSSPYMTSTIQQLTIASKGNTKRFGDLSVSRSYAAGVCNSTRGIFSGGGFNLRFTQMDYITMASEGNAVEFGENMVGLTERLGGASTQIRGTWAGGSDPNGGVNHMEYVTIATKGDAIDFGDLGYRTRGSATLSDSHGGLGGY